MFKYEAFSRKTKAEKDDHDSEDDTSHRSNLTIFFHSVPVVNQQIR